MEMNKEGPKFPHRFLIIETPIIEVLLYNWDTMWQAESDFIQPEILPCLLENDQI